MAATNTVIVHSILQVVMIRFMILIYFRKSVAAMCGKRVDIVLKFAKMQGLERLT